MTSPFPRLNLSGSGTQRGVTLALPTDAVRRFLPAGLELGSQDVSPRGTHPVIVFFHDIFRAYMSFPTLIPSLTYREHSVGVPFTYIASSSSGTRPPGPYYYMPTLYLDSALATMGGIMYWGFTKKLAAVTVTEDRYTVCSPFHGLPITSLHWTADTGHEPIRAFERFEAIRQMLSQPVVSMLPMGLGPVFVLSDFEKQWDVATIRPLETVMEVHRPYLPGYAVGRYPEKGRARGIDGSVLGSYELSSPLRLSLPYPPGVFGS